MIHRTPAAALTGAALVAAMCLPLGGARLAAGQRPAFRAGIDLVTFGVTVTDGRGQLVSGLEAEDFEIYEDGQKQTLRYFASGQPAGPDGPPLHLGLLLDVSESMDAAMDFTKGAAIRFLNTLVDAVDITVVTFDTEVRVTRHSQSDFVRVIERIRQLDAVGWTALYDAIGVYLDGAAELDGRTIMLLYTDGGDTTSALRFRDLVDLLKASDVTVYVIGELAHHRPSSRILLRRTLTQIAGTTGGQAFFPGSERELEAIYAQVLAEIRAQYTVGYVSTSDATDGAWRNVEIRIAGRPDRDYRVRARGGYYGPYRKP